MVQATVLKQIQEGLATGNQRLLREAYRNFKEISAKNYTTTEYPRYEDLPLYKNDVHFMLIYKELCYRHVVEDLKQDVEGEMRVSLSDYQDSFQNYIDLFNCVITLDDNTSSFTLPPGWIWDTINSFVNQFVDYQKYISDSSEPPKTKIWEVQMMLKYLHFMAEQAGFDINEPITQEIVSQQMTGNTDARHYFGFFSLCGLLRVYSQTGDFASALAASDILSLYQERQSRLSPSFRTASAFYRGYCLFMTRRWRESEELLQFVQNNSQRSDVHEKYAKNLLTLLAAVSFGSSLTDETEDAMEFDVQQLKDSVEQEENFATITETFKKAPGFLTQENLARHAQAFKKLLSDLPQNNIRPLLELYTSIKLGSLEKMTKKNDLELHCALLHQKLQSEMEHNVTDLKTGRQIQSSEMDFYVDSDTMHVTRIQKQSSQCDSFLCAIDEMARV